MQLQQNNIGWQSNWQLVNHRSDGLQLQQHKQNGTTTLKWATTHTSSSSPVVARVDVDFSIWFDSSLMTSLYTLTSSGTTVHSSGAAADQHRTATLWTVNCPNPRHSIIVTEFTCFFNRLNAAFSLALESVCIVNIPGTLTWQSKR